MTVLPAELIANIKRTQALKTEVDRIVAETLRKDIDYPEALMAQMALLEDMCVLALHLISELIAKGSKSYRKEFVQMARKFGEAAKDESVFDSSDRHAAFLMNHMADWLTR